MSNANSNVQMADLSRATDKAVKAAINESVDINHFRPYDSQLPVPDLKGYRTVKCLYKTPKGATKAEYANSYIRVSDHITEQAVADKLADFAPYFVAYLQEQENALVKELHKRGETKVASDYLSLDTLLAFLEESNTSSRLNGDAIAAWFNDYMRDSLLIAFSEKMGLSDEPTAAELEKLAAILSTYENKYKSLASGKTAYRKEEAELLQRALEVTEADKTTIGARFYKRLEAMKTATADDLLMSL